jgi:predicted RNase H-like nuclease
VSICIIGIDCATDARKVGLSRGFLSVDQLTIDRLTKPVTGQSVSDVVSDWIDIETPTLLAVDAPLGWPESLGEQLKNHKAGNLINVDSNNLFRRHTDKFIKRAVGKQPLDVGADRIARTAHSALKYLDEIGKRIGCSIPLAWDTEFISEVSAIEVYPAATLKLSGFRFDGYKKTEHRPQRIEIVEALSEKIQFETDISVLEKDDDVLDAAVCVLAGSHFLSKQCIPPDDLRLAKKEGWIWVQT